MEDGRWDGAIGGLEWRTCGLWWREINVAFSNWPRDVSGEANGTHHCTWPMGTWSLDKEQ